MYSLIVLLCLFHQILYSRAAIECCQGENIVVNGTCWDGSNIISLSCDIQILRGPTEDNPSIIEVTEDGELTITEKDKESVGYFKIESDKFCITKGPDNYTELAYVCYELDEEEQSGAAVAFFYLKSVCALITVLLLTAILVIYIFVPDLRDIEGICVINFTATWWLGYLLIAIIPALAYIEPYPCDTSAFLYYTSVLCSINWLSLISFHLWRNTLHIFFQTRPPWLVIYWCYGYGLPLLLLATALVVHKSQDPDLHTGVTQCLFDGNAAVWIYFYAPVMIILLISAVLQIWAAKRVWCDIDSRECSHYTIRWRRKCLVYGHLFLIITLVHVVDMISFICLDIQSLQHMWDVFDCRNLLAGGVVFFILVVLRNKVLKALAKRGLCCIKFPKKWEKLIDQESESVEYEQAALTRDNTYL